MEPGALIEERFMKKYALKAAYGERGVEIIRFFKQKKISRHPVICVLGRLSEPVIWAVCMLKTTTRPSLAACSGQGGLWAIASPHMRTTVVLGQVGVGESNARTCLGWFEREPSEKVSEVTPVAIPNILGLLGIATNVGLGLYSPSSRSNHPKQVRALGSPTPTCLRMTVARISSNPGNRSVTAVVARGHTPN